MKRIFVSVPLVFASLTALACAQSNPPAAAPAGATRTTSDDATAAAPTFKGTLEDKPFVGKAAIAISPVEGTHFVIISEEVETCTGGEGSEKARKVMFRIDAYKPGKATFSVADRPADAQVPATDGGPDGVILEGEVEVLKGGAAGSTAVMRISLRGNASKVEGEMPVAVCE